MARLSPQLHDLAIYTSDSRALGLEKAVPGVEIAPSLKGLSLTLDNLPTASTPEVEMPGLGIKL